MKMSKAKIFVNGKLRNYNEYEPNLQGRTMPLYIRVKKPKVGGLTLYYEWGVGWAVHRLTENDFKNGMTMAGKKSKMLRLACLRNGVHVKEIGEITFPTKEQHRSVFILSYVWGQRFWINGRETHVASKPMPDELKAFIDVDEKFVFHCGRLDETKDVYRFKKSLLAVLKDYGVKIKKTKSVNTNYWYEDTIKLKIEIDYSRCNDLDGFLKSLGYVNTEVQELIVSKLKEKRSQGYA